MVASWWFRSCCTHLFSEGEEEKETTAKLFHIRYVSMHTWIIDFLMERNTETSRSKCVWAVAHWKKWEHIGYGCICICVDVNVWAFINKARLDAFGCNYKPFFTWYALHIAFHSFVPTIFFSPFFFLFFFWFGFFLLLLLLLAICTISTSLFSIIESNKIGMQFVIIHVACSGIRLYFVCEPILSLWAFLCNCVCICLSLMTLIHCKKITFHDITFVNHHMAEKFCFWILVLWCWNIVYISVSIASLSILVNRTLCLVRLFATAILHVRVFCVMLYKSKLKL